METVQQGDRVKVVGHPDHVLPPVLEGMEGIVRGKVLEIDVRDRNLVRVGIDGLRTPPVQLHVEQLEAAR